MRDTSSSFQPRVIPLPNNPPIEYTRSFLALCSRPSLYLLPSYLLSLAQPRYGSGPSPNLGRPFSLLLSALTSLLNQ